MAVPNGIRRKDKTTRLYTRRTDEDKVHSVGAIELFLGKGCSRFTVLLCILCVPESNSCTVQNGRSGHVMFAFGEFQRLNVTVAYIITIITIITIIALWA